MGWPARLIDREVVPGGSDTRSGITSVRPARTGPVPPPSSTLRPVPSPAVTTKVKVRVVSLSFDSPNRTARGRPATKDVGREPGNWEEELGEIAGLPGEGKQKLMAHRF